MKLSQHEQKILDIVSNHPDIMDNPEKRESIAELYGLSEKTLRNRTNFPLECQEKHCFKTECR